MHLYPDSEIIKNHEVKATKTKPESHKQGLNLLPDDL